MSEKNHAHILIFEDNPGIATSQCSGLEREGFKVTWKDKWEDGITFAQTQTSHLIILDVRLPDGKD